ncbi:hypothetical protein [Confluentibacter sediminis]|nr:hypothetical protein [Confluentibacter sediminis]
MEIAYSLKFLKEDNFKNLYANTREIERMLTSFIKKSKSKNFETLKP